MVAKRKLYARLDALEAQLKEELITHLTRAVAAKHELVLCVDEFNPFPALKARTDKTTERLVSLGAEILALREKLGEPADHGSPAARICWYCREWGDLYAHHRQGARGLAQSFLGELEGTTD